MKKKFIKGLGILSFLSFMVVGGMVASGNEWQDNYVYFSDESLRTQVVSVLKTDGIIVENELPTIKQMQSYGMNVSNNPDESKVVESEITYEGGRSIAGLEYFSNKIKKISGSESSTRDISPLFRMNQLEEVKLLAGFIDKDDEMQKLLIMPEMKKVEIKDTNTRFRSFSEIRFGENLTYLRYANLSEYPTQYINTGDQKLELFSPIRILENEELTQGTLTYTSSDKNFSTDGQTLTWTKPRSHGSFNWKYEYKQDGKDFEIKGKVDFDVLEK